MYFSKPAALGFALASVSPAMAFAIEKRTPIAFSSVQLGTSPDPCTTLNQTTLSAVTNAIAQQMKADSNANDCTVHSGSSSDVNFSMFATGKNCDTTAQATTMQGALAVYLEGQASAVCDIRCVKMTHGSGTYTSFLTIAPGGTDISGTSCTADEAFGDAGSGGDNDVPS